MVKPAGKRTVHPERVVFGGRVFVVTGVGEPLGWAGGLQVLC